MPTVDRLAAPPTVHPPTQADEGAQLFWLHCQPCHGDQGQGLTDEWRAQFPEGSQNCWQSGCHSEFGKDLPENGFVLPTSVPAVIGEGSLEKFATAHQLYSFIRGAMPYEAPGRLTDEEYLALTAFIARAHGAWDGTPFSETNLVKFQLDQRVDNNLLSNDTMAQQSEAPPASNFMSMSTTLPLLVSGLILVVFFVVGAWLWHRQEK